MKNILFVCTGNRCRSVMAEGLFKKMIGSRAGEFKASSAGISATDGFPASPETVQVMKSEEIDVSDHRSQSLRPEMISAAHKIYVMERMHKEWILRLSPEAKDKVFLMTDFHSGDDVHGDTDIPDPIHMSFFFYRNVLSVIHDCVKKIVENL